jgi:transcriptional regulator with XRE-family HTH domain
MRSQHSAAYKAFCAQLKQARLNRRMTQADVATALSIPRSRVIRMESGERRVDVIELAAFMKLYRKPFSYFLPPKK